MEPSERVVAYVSDWHRAWKTAKKRMGKDVDFDVWRGLIGPVDEAHFVAGKHSGSAGSFGTPPSHDPAKERVTNVTAAGEGFVIVETTSDEGTLGKFHEYDLVRAGDDWRIDRILVLFSRADQATVDADKRAACLGAAKADAPWEPLPADVEPNGDRLFEDGRKLEHGGTATTTSLHAHGELQLSSGIIGFRDFGYDVYGELEVVTRKVKPGRYPVQTVHAFDRVAAVRVLLSSERVKSWHPAVCTGGGHVVGVDAGNVAIFDAAAFAEMKNRRRERLFSDVVGVDGGMAPATFVSLAGDGANDCVVVESGYGDGGYPAYWGVDARGDPAVFLVDFMMLGEESGAGYRN